MKKFKMVAACVALMSLSAVSVAGPCCSAKKAKAADCGQKDGASTSTIVAKAEPKK